MLWPWRLKALRWQTVHLNLTPQNLVKIRRFLYLHRAWGGLLPALEVTGFTHLKYVKGCGGVDKSVDKSCPLTMNWAAVTYRKYVAGRANWWL